MNGRTIKQRPGKDKKELSREPQLKHFRPWTKRTAIILGCSIILGGCVVFFGYMVEMLIDTFGRPIGLGMFVAMICAISASLTND